MKQKWAIFLFVGISLALIRIFVSGHFNVTGIKLIPEFIMIITFWIQTLLIGLGITLWFVNKKG